ncbi:phosphoenolpyruvate synthase, partial [Candidatus Pacearchaeota archaeon]|nr:phosphoenolpyruvate synthase [Candidatus Pacearchaeota archaeon]
WLDKLLLKNDLVLSEDDLDENVKEINGSCACKGKVKGKVRLILYKRDLVNFKKNEILVTEMTSPEFVPAMKKACAIITDEGGITCHAAIVSRELNIPCIIGTRVGTKVLHDGQMIEVDADLGIVRIK